MKAKISEYLGNTFIIFLKEFRAYFNSPTAYVVLVVFLLISGWLFASTIFINDQVTIRQFINNVPLLYIFFLPAISMRLIAEEVKVGTMELLATMPIKDYEIVLGKFLAALALLTVLLVLTLFYPLSLAILVKGVGLDWGQVFGAYLGLFFIAAGFLSIGIFASSTTKNQVVAFIFGFLICFAFFIVGKFVPVLPGGIREVVNFIGIDSHFVNISKGVIDSRDILYFFSLTGFFIYLATIMVNARKWR